MDSTIQALEQRLKRMEDLEEIRRLVARYGRAVDDRDWDTLTELYAPDAVFESAGTRSEGRDQVIEFVKMRTSVYPASYHYPHSHEIEILDDSRAEGLVCAHAELAIDGDTVVVALRYHDDYRRVDGCWCFRERVAQLLYVLKAVEYPRGLGDPVRVRWPGTEPQTAQVGADVAPAPSTTT